MSLMGRRRPIVLYQPRDQGAWMPLGLVALGSQLSGEQVVIVDGRFELAPEARIVELVRDASCLGVSVRTGPPLRDALRVSGAARAANPRLTVFWGGPHASRAPESCLATGVVDACALGAGEQSLVSALRTIRGGRSLAEVPGLVVRDGPRGEAEPLPEAQRTACARYALIDVERHFEARGARRLDYCSSRGVREQGWQGLPADRVLAETAELAERHSLSEVLFRDEDFFADPARADAIVGGLGEAPGRLGWRVSARPEDVVNGGQQRLAQMAHSGCRGVVVIPPADVPPAGPLRDGIILAARRLHDAGLVARFELRIGRPGHELTSVAAAVSLARALCAIDAHFETPIGRLEDPPEPATPGQPSLALEAWAARDEAPWSDLRAERRLRRAAFYFSEAQRAPRRRPSRQLLRMLSLLRVRLGFFGIDVERRLVDASALLRTGRPRSGPQAD